jgi:hypothetical protein
MRVRPLPSALKLKDMWTTDEWGRTIYHMQTGREGYKMLTEMGIKPRGGLSEEEYEKHMESWRKIYKARQDKMWEQLMEFFNNL